MAEQRCERTELLVDQCAHCLGHKPAEEQATAETAAEHADFLTTHPRWFPARYPGTCEPCGTPFDVGTPITGTSWRDGGWRAYCCQEAS